MATDLKTMQSNESMSCNFAKERAKKPILIAAREFSVNQILTHTARIFTPYFSALLLPPVFPPKSTADSSSTLVKNFKLDRLEILNDSKQAVILASLPASDARYDLHRHQHPYSENPLSSSLAL